MQWDILERLVNFVEIELVESLCNVLYRLNRKHSKPAHHVIDILEELRDAWRERRGV